jgi:hypothetical protein
LFSRSERTARGIHESLPIDNTEIRDQSKIVTCFSFVDDVPMSRIVRHLLLATVVACHAVVTLSGPCLHGLFGASHEMGAATKSQRPDDPAQSRRDSADNCLICHFVAQGQLPVEFAYGPSNSQVTDHLPPADPASVSLPIHLPSSPRAPPVAAASTA